MERHLDRARTAAAAGDLAKALKCWRAGYTEALESAYGFHEVDYLCYADYLSQAGYAEDSINLLKQLHASFKNKLSASPQTPEDHASYCSSVAAIYDAISLAFARHPSESSRRRQLGAVLYSLLHHLSRECSDYHSGYRYGNPGARKFSTDVYYTYRMRDTLKRAGLNKQGRPEELQTVLIKYWALVPQLDLVAMQRDILALLSKWQPNP